MLNFGSRMPAVPREPSTAPRTTNSVTIRRPALDCLDVRAPLPGGRIPLSVWQQYDLAEHSAFAQHLVRLARLFERQASRDQGLYLSLFEQVQQR